MLYIDLNIFGFCIAVSECTVKKAILDNHPKEIKVIKLMFMYTSMRDDF